MKLGSDSALNGLRSPLANTAPLGEPNFAGEFLLFGHEAQKVIVSTGCGVAPSSCRAT